jgi:Domain of unknown function (DUF2828)
MSSMPLSSALVAPKSIVSVMDSLFTTTTATSCPGYQYGENNHVEYKTVSVENLTERILQFHFQLVRTKDEYKLRSVASDTREILGAIMAGIHNKTISEKEHSEYINMGVIMFKLLAHTRDIVSGKGEYMLFYIMLVEWAKIDLRFFDFVIKSLVYDSTSSDQGTHQAHPLGSWKDMKYFLTFMKNTLVDDETIWSDREKMSTNNALYSHLVNTIVSLINEQLRIDSATLAEAGSSFSLAAKWVPREKSKKFGWMYHYLAMNYSQHQIPSDSTHPSHERAVTRAFMIYRKLMSEINRRLDTTQIKQCGHKWAEIDFNNVTSITMNKQTKSFLNVKQNGKTLRYDADEDRNECSINYEQYMLDVVKGDKKIKGARVSVIDFVKSAIDVTEKAVAVDSPLVTTINEQWKDNARQTGNLTKIITMCDVSGSMTEDNSNPLYSAIGLSIRVAEKSVLGPRIMTFSEVPSWIQLGTEDSDTFVKQVAKVRKAHWGMTTNFYAALDLIRKGIEDNKLPREVAEDLAIVIFSDMQLNNASSEMGSAYSRNTMLENIKLMFSKMGERLYGEPINPPHIIFWNLRKTTGFPAISTDANVSMMSGFSPALLNVFCDKGIDGLRQYTPWLSFMETLSNSRYSAFEAAFKNVVA